jgi:hypothetical protein
MSEMIVTIAPTSLSSETLQSEGENTTIGGHGGPRISKSQ